MRALILEDDERLRSIVVRTLTRAGLACDEASSIAEAEELLFLHGYDLLVLDRRLPDGDGLDVCRRARTHAFRNSILMLTAMDDAEQEVEGLAEGADDYLGKPFDLDVLTARIKALLRRNEVRRASGADGRRPSPRPGKAPGMEGGAAADSDLARVYDLGAPHALARRGRLARRDSRAGLG